MGEGLSELARSTLIMATAGTVLLWTATVALALTHYGSDRLHMTLLTGSFLAGVATMALAGARFVNAKIRAIADELGDAIRQGADELHTVVAVTEQSLTRDRLAAVHALTTQLRCEQGRDGQVA